MSGILDNKSRVIDAMLTFEGRRQIADGNFVVKYVTFSDRAVVYDLDVDNGHVDPTNRIYIESFNSPYDQIIFEADDSGKLLPFRQHNNIGVSTVTGSVTSSITWTAFIDGKLKNRVQKYSSSSDVTGSFSENLKFLGDFSSQIEGILTSSIDNFRNLYAIGTIDQIFEDYNFALSSNEITFTVPSNQETLSMQLSTNVNMIDSLFNDEKLRNVDNFRYLPPIKKSTYAVDKTSLNSIIDAGLLLGDYPPWGPVEKLEYSKLKKELDGYESKTIFFDPTSRDNDIIGQFFEIANGEVKKLDIISYGAVHDNSDNPYASTKHIFFVGKVVVDETGSDCFVHLFTLVFSSSES